MTTQTRSLINPDPVDEAGKHAHRAGAPNHHHTSGSGENPMVGTKPTVDPTTVDAVRAWLFNESYRFLSLDDHGRLTVRLDTLADLVTEIVTEMVTEHTSPLRAELDAANDAVTELIAQLDECRRALDGGVAA